MKRTPILLIPIVLAIFVGCTEYDKEWVYEVDSHGGLSAPAIGHDGTVYVTDATSLIAVASDGTELWEYGFSYGSASAPTVGPDSTIYFEDRATGLVALSHTGELKWEFVTNYPPWGKSPAIDENGNIYLMSGFDSLYSFDSNGQLRWAYGFEYYDEIDPSPPAIGPDGTVYVRCVSFLYSFNPDGNLNWFRESGIGNPAIGEDGEIYFADGGSNNSLVCLNPDSTVKWMFEPDESQGQISITGSPAIGEDGTVYISGSSDKRHCLFAVDADGNFKWKCKVRTFSFKSRGIIYYWSEPDPTPTIGADGTIYFPYEDKLFAISPDGEVIWKFDTDGLTESPTIDSDGTLYLCGSKKLYALSTYSYGLALSPWPRQGGNNQNTGQVTP